MLSFVSELIYDFHLPRRTTVIGSPHIPGSQNFSLENRYLEGKSALRTRLRFINKIPYTRAVNRQTMPYQIDMLQAPSVEGRCPTQPTRRYGQRRELPHRVKGASPAGNAFWHILKATERYFLHLYTDALSSSNSISCFIIFWGGARRRFGAIAPTPMWSRP